MIGGIGGLKSIIFNMVEGIVFLFIALIGVGGWLYNEPIGVFRDYYMLFSLNDPQMLSLIDAVERYEKEKGVVPESLDLLYPNYLSKRVGKPDKERYFRYTRYPQGDSEYKVHEYTLVDGSTVEYHCNAYLKCVGDNKIFTESSLLEVLGTPTKSYGENYRDWEIAAVFPRQYNINSEDSFELRYWSSRDYPKAATDEGWYYDGYTNDDTALGKNEFFSFN